MHIPPKHLPRYLDSIKFPVEVRSAGGDFTIREYVSRETLIRLIRKGMVEGKGSATRVRYLRMRVEPVEIGKIMRDLDDRNPLNEGSRTAERDPDTHRRSHRHVLRRCAAWPHTVAQAMYEFLRDERTGGE